MRTVTQRWALAGPNDYQKNFNTKAELMLYLAQPWFLDQFEVNDEFAILPVYVVVEAEPQTLQLEYHK